jgi:hypothetical protein
VEQTLRSGLFFLGTANVDEVVGDHAEPDPALHSGIALVSAAIEAVPPLGDADASLASGPPLLAIAEPALPLLTLPDTETALALMRKYPDVRVHMKEQGACNEDR